MSKHDALLIRRVISLASRGEGIAVGWLEDNFHHFGVTVEHRRGQVSAVRVLTVRFPWSTCGDAGAHLGMLVGLPLSPRPTTLSGQLAMPDHCTHLFELAALVMAHATTDRAERRYDARVWANETSLPRLDGALWQDNAKLARWSVTCNKIIAPAELCGQSLLEGFRERLNEFDDETAEHLWILRRVFWLAEGARNFSRKGRAADVDIGPVCHTFLPDQRSHAYAMPKASIDINMPRIHFIARESETP